MKRTISRGFMGAAQAVCLPMRSSSAFGGLRRCMAPLLVAAGHPQASARQGSCDLSRIGHRHHDGRHRKAQLQPAGESKATPAR